ncbi:MAG: ABC transporter substrate-binding protein [bacterium]|nr:ABC transporter substrate-binding protein [bacterium]
MKRLVVIAWVIGLMITLSAQLNGEKIVRIVNFSGDIPALTTFDQSFDPDSYSLKSQVFDSLLHSDLKGKIVPGLAVSWKQLDSLNYQFKLRKGVKFHDGSPFTAADVKYTYDTVLNPATKSGTAWVLGTIAKITQVDDFTVKITTKHPDGMLLHRLTMFGLISSKTYTQKVGLEKAKKKPVGTGPFSFVKHIPGKEYILAANKNYWRKGIPGYDKLIFKIVPEKEWADALIKNQVDIAPNLSGKKGLAVVKNPNLKVVKRLVLQSYWVLISDKGPLAKTAVRKALNYALKKTDLIKFGDSGNGKPQASLGKIGEFGYNETLTPYPYDPAKAKQLMAEAGHGGGFTIKLLAADVTANVAKIMRAQLKKIGVTVEVEIVSRPEWAKRVVVGKITGKPYTGDMAMNLVDNPIYNQAFHSGLFLMSKSPWALLNSKEFDDKFIHALTAPNLKEHEKRLKELDKYIYDNALLLFTYQRIRTVGINKKLNLPGISVNGHIGFFMLSDITFK